jgi:hypothetical protein
VDWQREAGRGRSVSELTLAQANQMLVHAGRVTPYRQDAPCGAALVGKRLSVYWDAKDALYVADVRAYDGCGERRARGGVRGRGGAMGGSS